MTKKYQDWHGWWDGLRSKAMQAGAESLVTNIGTLITTNGIANMKVPGLSDIGEGWKTAVAGLLSQFTIRVVFAAAKYVAMKPDPDVITETTDTTFQARRTDGTVVNQSSSTTVTKPISPSIPTVIDQPKP